MILNVKKYPNRKFYLNGKYINLKDIEQAVITGNKVKVYDHKGNDITYQTHGKILANIFKVSTPQYVKEYLYKIGIL